MSIGSPELKWFFRRFHIPIFGLRKGSAGSVLEPQAIKTCIHKMWKGTCMLHKVLKETLSEQVYHTSTTAPEIDECD